MIKPAIQRTNIIAAGTNQTGTGTTDSAIANMGGYTGFVAYLNVTAHVGGTGTLDIKFQDTPDGGTTWFDIASATFTQVTSTDGKQRLVVNNAGPKVKAVVTRGGTSPNYTFGLDVCGIN